MSRLKKFSKRYNPSPKSLSHKDIAPRKEFSYSETEKEKEDGSRPKPESPAHTHR